MSADAPQTTASDQERLFFAGLEKIPAEARPRVFQLLLDFTEVMLLVPPPGQRKKDPPPGQPWLRERTPEELKRGEDFNRRHGLWVAR